MHQHVWSGFCEPRSVNGPRPPRSGFENARPEDAGQPAQDACTPWQARMPAVREARAGTRPVEGVQAGMPAVRVAVEPSCLPKLRTEPQSAADRRQLSGVKSFVPG